MFFILKYYFIFRMLRRLSLIRQPMPIALRIIDNPSIRTFSMTARVSGLGYVPVDKIKMTEEIKDPNVFVFDVR